MKIHKLRPAAEAPCGAQYYNFLPKGPNKSAIAPLEVEKLPTSYYWKKVTCKNCLKHRPK